MKQLAVGNRNISGVYARNSYALGTWEPGRSDIDLTVIWSDPREDAIHHFLRSYARLQKRFPMLGEIEIIDADHLHPWATHGFAGLHFREWKRIAGAHSAKATYKGREELDRIRHAVSVYRNQFLRYFWANAPAHTLGRVAAKIFKLLGNYSVPAGNADRLLHCCLCELSRAVKNIALPVAENQIDIAGIVGKLYPPQMPDQPRAIKGVHCVAAPHVNPAQKHVVVEGDFHLEKIKAEYPGAILWSGDLFRFYVSFVDPVEYFAMLRERIVFLGQDPFLEELPMTDELLKETVCQYTTHMLTYPYRMEAARLSDSEFEHVLYGWYLRVVRYFEDGTLDYDYRTLREYFGTRFSHHPSRFSLLHGIATELAAHLSADAPMTFARDFQRTG